MRPVDEIIVHCSATRWDWMLDYPTQDKVNEIRRWHMSKNPPWRDIGYHYIVDRNGTVATGRPVEQVGAHVKNHNTGTIGVCLIGGHGASASDQFEDHFTTLQDKALRQLIKDLKTRHNIVKVTGHNQYSAKGCPGFYVPKWLGDTPKEIISEEGKPEPATEPPFFARMWQKLKDVVA